MEKKIERRKVAVMIDLHLHTTHSDGTDSVEKLLKNAEKNKLEIISITDHNTLGAYFELENTPELRKNFSGKIITGAEIKTSFEKTNIEILAYGIDYHDLEIKEEKFDDIQKEELKYFIKVGKKLGIKCDENIVVDKNDSSKYYASWVYVDEVTKYKENEKIIKKLGGFDRITFYRNFESNIKSPFYYDTTKYYDDINTLIDKIHKAGGLAFLAHGLIYPFEDTRKSIGKIVTTTEIDGLECVYPLFDDEGTNFMIEICKKYNKYTSGGTDYHAKNKPNISMGTGINNNVCIEKDFIRNWFNLVKKI